MSYDYRQRPALKDQLQKLERLVFNCALTSSATPANKVLTSDMPDVGVLRCQGETAQADAIENVASQVSGTATDSTGVCAILIDDQIDIIYNVTVTPSVGTLTSTAIITTGGRLLINIDSNQSFASQGLTFTVFADYKSKA